MSLRHIIDLTQEAINAARKWSSHFALAMPEINREAGENACTSVWYGGTELKKWAIKNGYPEVADMPNGD